MKTWLIKHRRWFYALAGIVVLIAVFTLGRRAGANATHQWAYAALWSAIVDLPDPEGCALCGAGAPYPAPCLIDLSTGQMDEMKVYTHHPAQPGETAPMAQQQTGTFSFQLCAGLVGIRDTCAHTCTVTLPGKRSLMDPALFCKECRYLLAQAGIEGYVVVDLYDPEHIQSYPIQAGNTQVIRDYRVTVTQGQKNTLEVQVAGLL